MQEQNTRNIHIDATYKQNDSYKELPITNRCRFIKTKMEIRKVKLKPAVCLMSELLKKNRKKI